MYAVVVLTPNNVAIIEVEYDVVVMMEVLILNAVFFKVHYL